MITVILLISACSKSNDNPEVPRKEFDNKIELNAPKARGEYVRLSWSKLTNNLFKEYLIMRKDFTDDVFNEILRISDNDDTKVFDVDVPYSPEITYQIFGRLGDGNTIFSNTVSYKKETIESLSISPFDVIHSEEDQLLYLFEKSGRISIYDLKSDKITKQIETSSTIGFADIESYQGKKELYVPRNDGWIFVYDAYTLEKITQIAIGLESYCVVSNRNILYVSTSEWTKSSLKVYQRSDRKLIEETGDFFSTIFRKVPGTNTSLLEVTLDRAISDQHFYEFNQQGKIQFHFSDRYNGDYPLNAYIFQFFPNGKKYITGNKGAIYNIDLTYATSLPRGNLYYTDFCFDNSGGRIYAGTTNRTIESYETNDYIHVKTLKTKAYPFRVFNTSQGLISVSYVKASYDQYTSARYNNKIIIEKLSK